MQASQNESLILLNSLIWKERFERLVVKLLSVWKNEKIEIERIELLCEKTLVSMEDANSPLTKPALHPLDVTFHILCRCRMKKDDHQRLGMLL